jgi:hypothetical protein
MKNKEDLNIWVISHKDIDDLFKYEDFHKHIHVGTAINPETKHEYKDNIGDNISDKNPFFCELTGIYWVWKNMKKTNYIGFEHYRRHFNLTYDNINDIFKTHDIILPKATYFKHTIYLHYQHAFSKHDIEEVEKIVKYYYPEYTETWNDFMFEQNKQYSRNMFITKYEIFDKMYTFIFNVLNEFIKREKLYTPKDFENHVLRYSQHIVDIDHKNFTNWVTYQMRLLGFLAEELTSLWIKHNIPEDKCYEIGLLSVNEIIPTNKI